jgi:hypothetical protein
MQGRGALGRPTLSATRFTCVLILAGENFFGLAPYLLAGGVVQRCGRRRRSRLRVQLEPARGVRDSGTKCYKNIVRDGGTKCYKNTVRDGGTWPSSVWGGQCGANSLWVDMGTHPCTLAFASNRFKHMNSAQSAMLLPNTCRQRTCTSSANRTRVVSLAGMERKKQQKQKKTRKREQQCQR